MRIGSVLASASALILALVLAPGPAAAAVVTPGQPVFVLSDPRLDEVSGLAVGHRNPGLLYVQNDSGDSARFFALDSRTGAVRAECDVPDAVNHDWEDLATGPSSAGIASVWLADIGDNGGDRTSVQLYRVDEPAITGPSCVIGPVQQWRLRYPDGPHDAESLIVDPVRHRAYLVTKALLGRSQVFEVPATAGDRVQTMTPVAQVQFRLTGTPGGPNPVGQLTATGASMSTDGRLLAVRTYTDAYLWPVRDGDVAAALAAAPTVLALPSQPQGEGIAIDGHRLLIDSEKVGSTVYAVPIPAGLLTGASVTAPASSAAGSTTAPASPGAGTGEPGRHRRATEDLIQFVAGGLVLLAMVTIAWRRPGRPSRR